MQVEDALRQRYEVQAPELLDAVAGKPGEYGMRRDAKTEYCVKFREGLCDIQRNYGAEMLSEACTFYPRATRTLGTEAVMTAALSCPEVARLSLFDDAAFAEAKLGNAYLPKDMRDCLPAKLLPAQAVSLHWMFIRAALDKKVFRRNARFCGY